MTPVERYLATLTTSSAQTMRRHLTKLARWASGGKVEELESFPWHALRERHTGAMRWALFRLYSRATVRGHLAGLKGVLDVCKNSGLMNRGEHAKATRPTPYEIKRIPRRSKRPPRELSRQELEDLFAACADDEAWADSRDAAVLALIYGAGLRFVGDIDYPLADYDGYDGIWEVVDGIGVREARYKTPSYMGLDPHRWRIRKLWVTGIRSVDVALGADVGRLMDQGTLHKDAIQLTGGAKAAVETWMKHRGDEPGPLIPGGPRDVNGYFGRAAERRSLGAGLKRARLRAFTVEDLYRTFARERVTAACRDLWGQDSADWMDTVWVPYRPDAARCASDT